MPLGWNMVNPIAQHGVRRLSRFLRDPESGLLVVFLQESPHVRAIELWFTRVYDSHFFNVDLKLGGAREDDYWTKCPKASTLSPVSYRRLTSCLFAFLEFASPSVLSFKDSFRGGSHVCFGRLEAYSDICDVGFAIFLLQAVYRGHFPGA